MTDYDSGNEVVSQYTDNTLGTKTNITRITRFIIMITIGSILTVCPMYWAWTTRGALEDAAREGVIFLPLEHQKTLVTFESLGYKVVLVRLTGENRETLGDIVYKRKMLEQQEMAYIDSINLKARAIRKEKQQIQALQEFRQEARDKQLIQEIETRMEITKEDSNDLKDIILGGKQGQ